LYRPVADLKSGIPALTEIPAPTRAIMFLLLASKLAIESSLSSNVSPWMGSGDKPSILREVVTDNMKEEEGELNEKQYTIIGRKREVGLLHAWAPKWQIP
jgi:hypothetical protein